MTSLKKERFLGTETKLLQNSEIRSATRDAMPQTWKKNSADRKKIHEKCLGLPSAVKSRNKTK